MEKFKAGKKVKCVSSKVANLFESGKKYEVESVLSDGLNVYDGSGDIQLVRYGSTLVSFEPLTTKFTAVSGDQSLFDLVGASDKDLYVFTIPVMHGIRASSTKAGVENRILAERKPYVEVWIPGVGELFVYQDKIYQCMSAEDGFGYNANHITGVDLLTGGNISLQYTTDGVISKPKGVC